MKSFEEKTKFIELRALGKSFESISKALNISKPTLILWSKEFELEIKNTKALFLDELKESYLITKEQRLKKLFNLMNKAEEQLDKRSFIDIPTEKLVKLYNELNGEISKELSVVLYEKDELAPLGHESFTTREV